MAGKAKNIEKEIAELRQQLNQHDYSYYVLNSPTVADVEYDALMRRLKDLETENPELIRPTALRSVFPVNLRKALKSISTSARCCHWTTVTASRTCAIGRGAAKSWLKVAAIILFVS